MKLASLKLKKLIIIQEEIYKSPKTKNKSALKKFLVSGDIGKFPVKQI